MLLISLDVICSTYFSGPPSFGHRFSRKWHALRPQSKRSFMEATIAYWGHIGIMERNMEATMVNFGLFASCVVSLQPASCAQLETLSKIATKLSLQRPSPRCPVFADGMRTETKQPRATVISCRAGISPRIFQLFVDSRASSETGGVFKQVWANLALRTPDGSRPVMSHDHLAGNSART